MSPFFSARAQFGSSLHLTDHKQHELTMGSHYGFGEDPAQPQLGPCSALPLPTWVVTSARAACVGSSPVSLSDSFCAVQSPLLQFSDQLDVAGGQEGLESPSEML